MRIKRNPIRFFAFKENFLPTVDARTLALAESVV